MMYFSVGDIVALKCEAPERGMENYVTNLYSIKTENFTEEIPRVNMCADVAVKLDNCSVHRSN